MDTVWNKSFIRSTPREVTWQKDKGHLYNRYVHKPMNENNILQQFKMCPVTVFLIEGENAFSILCIWVIPVWLSFGNDGCFQVSIPHNSSLLQMSQQLSYHSVCSHERWGPMDTDAKRKWVMLAESVSDGWRQWALSNYSSALDTDARRKCD